MKSHLPAIRAVLREYDEGLTVEQILHLLPHIKHVDTIRNALKAMPDAYIDRWLETRNGRGQYSAVWCVVVPPAHCPHPTERKTRTIYIATGATA